MFQEKNRKTYSKPSLFRILVVRAASKTQYKPANGQIITNLVRSLFLR
jgi:hypothetical protein